MKINEIIALINAVNNTERINNMAKLVRDIFILKKKLAEPDKQNWYFRKGINSQVIRLKKLTKRYESIKTFINKHSLDDIVKMKEKAEQELKELKAKSIRPLFARKLILSGKSNEINGLAEMIDVKEQFYLLKSISYLKEYPEELILFF
ncbi:MAG TPA: hypothetical protein VKS21_09320 [Spirochaetota bacterium]|nr:hypothetical protein [Spirochaetota bacterium]